MSAQPRTGPDPTAGSRSTNGSDARPAPAVPAGREGVARRLARDDRSADVRPRDTHTHPAGSTASADAVEQLRRSITDIKHDIRMLKVGLDKQGIAIDRIVAALEDLASTEEE